MSWLLNLFLSNKYVRWIGAAGLAILSVLLVAARMRKQGERIAELKVKVETKDAVLKTKERMDAVPRPDKSDAVDRLRDKTF